MEKTTVTTHTITLKNDGSRYADKFGVVVWNEGSKQVSVRVGNTGFDLEHGQATSLIAALQDFVGTK